VRGTLIVVGAIFELAGIVLLGFPDFLPGAVRFSGWFRRLARRGVNLLRRLVGLSPRGVVHSVGLSGGITMGGSVSAVVSTGAKTLEDKVEYLLRRDRDAQRAFNDLAGRVSLLETESPRRLAELRGQMEEHVGRELTAALEVYRPLRIIGVVALVVGLGCVTAASLV